MNKALRKAVIAGNWKMNKTPCEAKDCWRPLSPWYRMRRCDVVACVPFVDLQTALDATAGSNIGIGAENCHWESSGAYTGEISAPMLKGHGRVPYVIIGHSERRTYFGETDVTVNKRMRAALDNGLTVILCVGEYLEQREQGITGEVVALQTKIALQGVSADELQRVIIAYEPVWAIGTGTHHPLSRPTRSRPDPWRCCRPLQLGCRQCAHHPVRRFHERPKRCRLLDQPDVDGGLIGGASLKPADFAEIVKPLPAKAAYRPLSGLTADRFTASRCRLIAARKVDTRGGFLF